MNFKKSDATDYHLFDEPILVSNHVKSTILGAKTESRFKSCTRDFEQQTLVYTTTKNENGAVKCYKEQLNMTSAYIEVAHTSVIFDNEVKLVKGRLVNKSLFKSELKGDKMYSNGGGCEGDENLTVSDLRQKIFKEK